MIKKLIILINLILFIPVFSYEIGGEIHIRSLVTEEDTDSDVEGRLLFSEEWEGYSLEFDYKVNDDEQKIDMATVKFSEDTYDLNVGRNRFGWGLGYNFNPTDVFNKTPVASTYDSSFRKEGRDSLILTKYISNDSLAELVYAFSQDDLDDDYGIRYRKNFTDTVVEGLVIRKGERGEFVTQEEEVLVGWNLKGNIGDSDWGYWNEAVHSFREEYSEFVMGIDLFFMEKFYFNLEYYRNGRGESSKTDYNPLLAAQGELLAKNYLIPSVLYQKSEKWELGSYVILNMDDESFQVAFPINYYYTQDLVFEITPSYIYGKSGTEYGIYSDESGDFYMQANLSLYF